MFKRFWTIFSLGAPDNYPSLGCSNQSEIELIRIKQQFSVIDNNQSKLFL